VILRFKHICRTAFAFRHQAPMHRRTHQFNAERHQRIEVVVERIAERRHEDYRPLRTCLMVVVNDFRVPLQEQLVIHVGGFRLVRHVKIAVVIVVDVLLPKARQASEGALHRIFFAHVPVRH
jgi:hypothetical protein